MAAGVCSHDFLGLLADPQSFQQSIVKAGGKADEKLRFSAALTKINRKDKAQERLIVLTDVALYNFHPKGMACKRRILITSIESVTVSAVSNEFAIHVPSEYDYRLLGPHRDDLIEDLQQARMIRNPEQRQVAVATTDDDVLKGVVTTRIQAHFDKGASGRKSPPKKASATPEEGADGDLEVEIVEPLPSIQEADEEDDDATTCRSGRSTPNVLGAANGGGAAVAAAGGDGGAGNAPLEIAMGDDEEEEDDGGDATGWSSQQRSRITLADFELMKVVGRGSFGKVMMVRKRDSREVLAMKVLKKSLIVRKNQVEHTQEERRILEEIDHPFLVKLRYAFQTRHKLYLVLPYLTGGELFFHLRRMRRFPAPLVKFYAAEIASGIGHLHSKGVVYRDLKPENILLDEDGHIRLTDFGLAKTLSRPGEQTQTFCGTPEYLAPEILLDEGHNKAVDWWSLGILIYEMLVGLPPFYSRDVNEMYDKIEEGKLVFPEGMPADAEDLLTRMLDQNPRTRLGSSERDVLELQEHPFFQEVDFEALEAKRIVPPFKPQVQGQDDTSNFDQEFTREDAVDSLVAESLIGSVAGGGFEGFTFVDRGSLGES